MEQRQPDLWTAAGAGRQAEPCPRGAPSWSRMGLAVTGGVSGVDGEMPLKKLAFELSLSNMKRKHLFPFFACESECSI